MNIELCLFAMVFVLVLNYQVLRDNQIYEKMNEKRTDVR